MNTLRSNQRLNTADSEAMVMGDTQFSIGSIAVHEMIKLLDQESDVLTHEFKRRAKDGEIIIKSYEFQRSHVLDFLDKYTNADQRSYLKISSQEWDDNLRNGDRK